MGQVYSSTNQKAQKTTPTPAVESANDMMRIIECPVCQEVPFPPIFQCVTGHNVCKHCRIKLKECPICKEVITDKRNYTVEALVQTYTHSCFNKSAGCDIMKTGELMEDHLKTCEYRPHPCALMGYRDCKENSLQLHGYKDHFRSIHNIKPLQGENIKVTYSFETPALSTGINLEYCGCCPSVLEFDGNIFLITMLIDYRTKMVYWTASCIGVEKEAEKYGAEITLTTEKARHLELSWRLPVYSILKGIRLAEAERNDVFQAPCTFSAFDKFILRSSEKAEEKVYIVSAKYFLYKFK